MANYSNYTPEQARTMYDYYKSEKERALRNNEIMREQTLKGVDRRLLQNGVNGGHQETTELQANSLANKNIAQINGTYDPTLAELHARMIASNSRGGNGRGREQAEDSLIPALYYKSSNRNPVPTNPFNASASPLKATAIDPANPLKARAFDLVKQGFSNAEINEILSHESDRNGFSRW